MQSVCTAWKNPIEGDVQEYINRYKMSLLQALVFHNVTNWQWIMNGIRAIESPFLPNPDSFALLCVPSPQDIGLPSFVDAYLQGSGCSTEKHPAVVYLLRSNPELGWTLRSSPQHVSRPIFDKAWKDLIRFVAGGGVIPEPELQISEAEHVRAPREVGEAGLSALRGLFS